MKLCVLVTTMHQDDIDKFYSMNLKSDTIIANQCEKNEIIEKTVDGHRVKMVSTSSRGTSLNRNTALAHCYDVDYIMFADDDLVFNDDYVSVIEAEFAQHPEAEAIAFNLEFISDDNERISMQSFEKWERATRRNMSSNGVWGVVINKNACRRANLFFDESFGPGTPNYCGEDTIFLQDMINRGLKMYKSEKLVAKVYQSQSTWYEGMNERYYESAGMILQRIYPKLGFALAIRSAYKHSKSDNSGFTFLQMLKFYLNGVNKVKRGKY